MAQTKKSKKLAFKIKEFVVYPSHGVGQITAIEEQEIAGMALQLYVISFEQEKMTLSVPVAKADSVGMRKLADDTLCEKAMTVLKGRARVKRAMWSRRAQEYEAKINSGDILALSEVVRDLFRVDTQPDQSYSERQLYEAALDRLAREVSAIKKCTHTEAIQDMEKTMSMSPKRKKALEAAMKLNQNDDEAASDDTSKDDSTERETKAA